MTQQKFFKNFKRIFDFNLTILSGDRLIQFKSYLILGRGNSTYAYFFIFKSLSVQLKFFSLHQQRLPQEFPRCRCLSPGLIIRFPQPLHCFLQPTRASLLLPCFLQPLLPPQLLRCFLKPLFPPQVLPVLNPTVQ